MVFEPTFEQIDDNAAALPDLRGGQPAVDPDGSDGGLLDGADDSAEDDVAEGEAGASIEAGDVSGDDLPPYGEE